MRHYLKPSLETLPPTTVLANGDYPTEHLPIAVLNDWINGGKRELICCDGAVNKLALHTDKLPDAVVGDLDSVQPMIKARLAGRIHHFTDQDTNDLTKTMTFVSRELKRQAVTLLGAAGGREDHLLGNLALLPSYSELIDDLVMLTDAGYFRLIQTPSTIEVDVGQQVSVFSFFGAPITLRGVHWTLNNQRLPALWVGTLNRTTEPEIEVSSPEPLLIFLANQGR